MLKYRYDVLFPFTGKIEKLTFNLKPELLTAETGTGEAVLCEGMNGMQQLRKWVEWEVKQAVATWLYALTYN